ncbi:GNAT family N-acetyltransferase [Microbacterium testaceum]|uniref:GNAT family N-acetyltransferase n=1 Tax=Microbacterium testaceum TaxID=2033 RepID=UPI00338D44CC
MDQPGRSPTKDEHNSFTRRFSRWWREEQTRCVTALAEVDGQLVRAAWLLLHERVPNPSHFTRATGDLQSVYVRPPFRRAGINLHLELTLPSTAL